MTSSNVSSPTSVSTSTSSPDSLSSTASIITPNANTIPINNLMASPSSVLIQSELETSSHPSVSPTQSSPMSSLPILQQLDKNCNTINYSEQQTKIPQPSPKLLHRSLSLRLRNTTISEYPDQLQNVILPEKSMVQHLHCSNRVNNTNNYNKNSINNNNNNNNKLNCSNKQFANHYLTKTPPISCKRNIINESTIENFNLTVATNKSPTSQNDEPDCSNGSCTNNITKKTEKIIYGKCSAGHQHHHPPMQLNLSNGGTGIRKQSPCKSSPSPVKTPGGCPNFNHHHHQSDGLRAVPKTPPVTPDTPDHDDYNLVDDDLDSVYSFASVASGRSTMSSCDHPFVARNGTTFSGRQMKYVVHCSNYAGQSGDEYLTPTQRAQRHIRKLKVLLARARCDLEQRDSEILRLTKEVVELRLFKASLSSPDERSNSSDIVTVRENNDLKTSQDVSPIADMTDGATSMSSSGMTPTTPLSEIQQSQQQSSLPSHHQTSSSSAKSSPRHILLQNALNHHQYLDKMNTSSTLSTSEMQSSCADSGNFEDMTTSSNHSKDSFVHANDDEVFDSSSATDPTSGDQSKILPNDGCDDDNQNSNERNNNNTAIDIEEQRQALIKLYEHRIEELIRKYDAETCDLKVTHNDRVEKLLQKLAECNTRYADLVPDYEQAKERIRELEKQLEDLQQKLQEQESKQNKMYLHMYTKGQEAERISNLDKVMDFAQQTPDRVSVPELIQQLQITQNELENIRDTNYRPEQKGNSQALLSAKEAISLWLLGARKTMYRRLIEAQQSKNKVDPEVTLQFLKSAIYYFLTDKENTQGHLNAIESILGFSDIERYNIQKARSSK